MGPTCVCAKAMGALMTKRQLLLAWANGRDWFYLYEVPLDIIGMSKQTCSTALSDFCRRKLMDFRVRGIKQYKIVSLME